MMPIDVVRFTRILMRSRPLTIGLVHLERLVDTSGPRRNKLISAAASQAQKRTEKHVTFM
jgi:hypothetical protein